MKILALLFGLLFVCAFIYIYKPFSYLETQKILSQSGEKIIALTFDDGPVPATTKLLDMLDEVDVKVTFFVIGEELSRRPDVTKKAFERGHAVGNHSWNHLRFLGFRSKEVMKEQIEKTNAELSKIGITARFIRAPFGDTTTELKKFLKTYTMNHAYWTLSLKDWKSDYSPEKIHAVFSNIHTSEIILMHDRAYEKPENLQALKEEILQLKKEGFTFVTIDQLKF